MRRGSRGRIGSGGGQSRRRPPPPSGERETQIGEIHHPAEKQTQISRQFHLQQQKQPAQQGAAERRRHEICAEV